MYDFKTFAQMNLDLIFQGFDRMPQPGEEVFAKRFTMQLGGGPIVCPIVLEQLGFRVRLMEHTHIAFACGSWLIGINSWYNEKSVFCLFLNLCKTVCIVADSIFIICGTRSDDNKEFVAFSGNYFFDLFISFSF